MRKATWQNIFFTVLFNTYINTSHATYSLQNEFNATNFFDEFDFFTGQDPTHGTVQYTNEAVAQQYNLIATKNSSIPGSTQENNVYFAAHDGAFNKSLSVSVSRPSIRLTSKQNYTKGLFVADIAHLPVAECGTWPAFWTTNLNGSWPAGGEIDIIEGVNTQSSNQITLHTAPNCSIAPNQDTYRGAIGPSGGDCAVVDNGAGCAIIDNSTASYGQAFNDGHGGVYAMEWTSQAISVWWWARRDIPADVASGMPNPSTWAEPVAIFGSQNCDIDALFQNHQIIFDITFCGDWAGQESVWGSQCSAKYGSSCSAYVTDNTATADAFREAYWEIASVKVYQNA